jgi:hypothetical protein
VEEPVAALDAARSDYVDYLRQVVEKVPAAAEVRCVSPTATVAMKHAILHQNAELLEEFTWLALQSTAPPRETLFTLSGEAARGAHKQAFKFAKSVLQALRVAPPAVMAKLCGLCERCALLPPAAKRD